MGKKAIIFVILLLITVICSFVIISGLSFESTFQGSKLHYLGRASIKLTTQNNTVIYIDPYAPGDYSEPTDIIIVTHQHADHNKLDLVIKKESTVIISAKDAVPKSVNAKIAAAFSEINVHGTRIIPVPAYNKNHAKEATLGFILYFDSISVYHASDTSFVPEMEDFAKYGITYALLPVDGFYNMGTEEAMKCAVIIKTKYSIPFHSDAKESYNEKNVKSFTLKNTIYMKPGESILLKP